MGGMLTVRSLDSSSIVHQHIGQLRLAMTLGCEEDVRFCPGRRK